jgi:CO/xanthine dehydrogenase Mo-binding subunit
MTSMIEKPHSRRDFLKGSGALVVAFTVPLGAGATRARGATAAIGPALIDAAQIDSWVVVLANGRVRVHTGKVELGTGLRTAQMQIAADELDVALDKIDLLESDTWFTPDQGTTAGSQSVKTNFAAGLRQACAEARKALIDLAATKLGVPASTLVTQNGTVISSSDSTKRATYGELIGGQRFNLRITGRAPMKKPAELKIVGRSVPHVDTANKVRSKQEYIHNVKVPGMLHGRVVRPPGINATLVSVNGFPKRIPDLVKVVVQKNFVGVVARSEAGAIKAAETLKVTWKDPGGAPRSHDELYAQMETLPAQARLLANDGDVAKALAGAAKVLEATYYYPYQLHGSMGPSCAIADVKADEATVWSPTQGVYPLRSAVARMLGFRDQQVHVIYKEGSGCYGLNGADTASLDAALLSKAVGAPVRLQWMRGDEHVWEHYGTPMIMKVRGGLDADGNLIAWDFESLQAARGGRPGNVGAANLPTGALIGLTLAPRRAQAPTFPPLGADNSNTEAGYLKDEEGLVPNARVIAKTVDSAFFTGPLRSPARIQNSFANESFIDELASAAGVDPVTYRLRYVGDERLRHCIEVVAKAAGWQLRNSPKPASTGDIATGRGIAAMQYEGEDGYAATVCEVEVNKKTGKVRVTRVVVSHDVGIIINPRGIKAQIEGNVVHGVSRALKEEVVLDGKTSKSRDWDSYQVLRFTELPEVKISLINRPNEAPTGSGENAMTAIPAAVANAVFDATGARIRRLPLTPARVKAAIAQL